MSYQVGRIIDARNNLVRIQHPDVPSFPRTVITSASAASATTLTVSDTDGFAQNDYVLIGELGGPTSELLLVNAAVSAGTSLPVAAATFAHPVDCPVIRFLWNQAEVSGASTVTGTKTVIATIALQPSSPQTEYVVSGTTYAYYFVRYKNAQTGTFSSYSDAAPAAGYDADTVRAVKTTALNLVHESTDDLVLTDDFLNTEIVNMEIDLWKEKQRWAHFYIDSYSLGTLTAGQVDYALPTDIADSFTDSAIRAVRVRQIGMLQKAEIETIEELLWDTAVATLAITANAGDTSITLDSVADFSDSGSAVLGSDSITYTGRNTSTNELTGIPASGDGSITATWGTTTKIWQGGQIDQSPIVFTVKPGYLNLVLPPSASYQGYTLWLDYYSKPTYPDSDADTVNWPDVTLYHNWLAWKIDMKRHNGEPTNAGITFKQQYDARKALMLARARLQDSPKFVPNLRVPRSRLNRTSNYDIMPWALH